jgi:molybdenum cofactor cytidylyltransferase
MRFDVLSLGAAEGAILAHGVRAGGRVFKKGRVLSGADLEALAQAGLTEVTAARLEPGDIGEDEAAARIAQGLAGDGIRVSAAFTGRVNLYAEQSGLIVFEPTLIDDVNLIDEAITIATLAPFARVAPGEMVATVKIIPFAAPMAAVAAATARVREAPMRVARFRPLRAGLISTQLPGQKASLLDKNRTALEARLAPLTGRLAFERRVPHEAHAVGDALRASDRADVDVLFVFGASAITDRRDVIPAGIEQAGGTVTHLGMPVDPGNLLLLGALDGKPVVGLPSCARSPKVNGFDFVLQRLFAEVPVTGADIMRMGVGGLLQEIPSRPQPREGASQPNPRAPRIAAIILAAGLSSRMGSNKLLAEWGGTPLVRLVAQAALKSQARPVLIVTGHEAAKVEAALEGLDVAFVRNPAYAEGLSASLKAGVRALPETADGALVLLGDMPEIDAKLIDRMIAAFSPVDGRAICIAMHDRKRGNPVLWARRFFAEIETMSGDQGAKPLLAAHDDLICEIESGGAVLRDVDTPDALAALRRGSLAGSFP